MLRRFRCVQVFLKQSIKRITHQRHQSNQSHLKGVEHQERATRQERRDEILFFCPEIPPSPHVFLLDSRPTDPLGIATVKESRTFIFLLDRQRMHATAKPAVNVFHGGCHVGVRLVVSRKHFPTQFYRTDRVHPPLNLLSPCVRAG